MRHRRLAVRSFVGGLALVLTGGQLSALSPPASAAVLGSSVVPAQFLNPPVGASSAVGMIGPFVWTPGNPAAVYDVMVGTSEGTGDVFSGFVPSTQLGLSQPNLPRMRVLWARIWTEVAGVGWFHGTDVKFIVR